MTHPDDNDLLKEILADEKLSALRTNSLQQGLAAMRQTRRRRYIARTTAMLILAVGVLQAFVLPKRDILTTQQRTSETLAMTSPRETPKTSSVKIISDEELLALFPDRSLALIGSPGRQQLVFLGAPAAN